MESYKDAKNLLSKIKIGWNLGNYLDCNNKDIKIRMSKSKSVEEVVSLWHNPIFNLKCFDSLLKYGINSVRLPVSWCNFIEYKNGKYIINNEIFDKLKEIINYALNLNFIIILNVHHDDKNWLSLSCNESDFIEVKNEFKQVWEQISYEFKDFSYNLIFEGINEVIKITDKEDWVGSEFYYNRLNELYEIFITTVRKTGGKNADRFLMITPYGAQIHKFALKGFKLPKDNNLIVDVHFYGKTDDKNVYIEYFSYLKQHFIDKNIPLIVGEIGLKKEYKDNFEYLKVLLNYMKELNLKVYLWDNGSSRKFIDRETGLIEHQKEFMNYIKKKY